MPHIHKLYDFVVSVFVVHKNKVLLIYHKKYNEWLPIGGHIELNEDPEQALYREIQEECGLKVRMLATKPGIAHPGVKPILTPSYVDTHRISETHKHTAFVYFGVAGSDKVKLHEREHREFRWLTLAELKNPEYKLTRSIYFYCVEALKSARKSFSAALVLLSLCTLFTGPLYALEIEYAKVFDVTGSVKFVGVKGAGWAPIPKNLLLKSGTRIKTGDQSTVQIKLNRDYTGVVKISSNSYLKLKNEPPNKLYLEKGDLYVIREAESEIAAPTDSGALLINTKDLQVEVQQGGCVISVTSQGTWVKVFQDKVQVTHLLTDRAKTKTWTVYEGYHLLAKSSEAHSTLKRMEYKDYEGWQKWIRSWYDHKDKLAAEKLRKELTV